MTTECEYCGTHASATGGLRMAADPHRGGDSYPCCHDCFCDGHTCEDCDWLDLPTLDEWADDWRSMAEAAADDRAHAAADRRAGL